jgi:CheY-like chemotaxis protein
VRIEVSNRVIGPAAFAADEPDKVPPGDYVSISVTDDGCGMTDEVRLRAVEPFFTTKGAGAGTGLGLSQIYGFVTQSGGALWIKSAPGAGTVISLLLPRAVSMPATARPAPAPGATRTGEGQHILLVEDDALLRQTMSDALRGRGYRVTEAEDGPAALTLLDAPDQDPAFELLFTDVVMPGGLSGVDLAVQVRKRRAALPVLFASGYSAASVLAGWPEPVDILAKPYSPEDVAARIAARLNQ